MNKKKFLIGVLLGYCIPLVVVIIFDRIVNSYYYNPPNPSLCSQAFICPEEALEQNSSWCNNSSDTLECMCYCMNSECTNMGMVYCPKQEN